MSFRFRQNTLKDKVTSASEVVGVIVARVIAYLGVGWIFQATYGAIAADGWVEIGFWPSVGIIFILNFLLEKEK